MNNNISVLIADDNEDLAKELSSYIGAKPNMTVTAIATDGEEAYTLISQTRPDAIILDLNAETWRYRSFKAYTDFDIW